MQITLTFNAPAMSPVQCVRAACVLEGLVGVSSAWVDSERGVASIMFDPASIALEDVRAELAFEADPLAAVWSSPRR